MVALKAELSPVIPGVPGVSGPAWDVFVAAGSDALPGTGTNLGTFNHNETGDTLSKGLNHAVVHHIASILYRREQKTPANTTPPSTGWVAPPAFPNGQPAYSGPTPGSMFPVGFNDLSVLRIKRHGATMLSTAITAAGVTMAVAATATIVVKGQPGDVAVANADCTFASANVAVATVATTGVVTGVAPGNTTVRVTNKYNGLMVDVQVAVTGTGIFLAGNEHKLVETQVPDEPKTDDDVTRWDDEWPDDRKSVIEQEEKDRKTVLLIEKEEKKPKAKAKGDDDDDDDDQDDEDELRAKKDAVDKAIRDKEASSNRNQDTTPADTKAKKAHENDKK